MDGKVSIIPGGTQKFNCSYKKRGAHAGRCRSITLKLNNGTSLVNTSIGA